ncbi:PTS N-acetylgalactosamine transporter subunit IIB [Clostridium beijerinckii]|uniref:PTS N-acetylgalactosamine transporter subunit IIB n=2 Tax=Clostridium beijerinckii TaxID=1520 RepID=A0AAW3WEV0_CLOBE|nr:PTS N-acetylgalactosamine transporter subunit IIB [Clostridium beijerinckii]MBC2477271.1 PTS N-acetylgalactosamine transporter subunit IIB [Clostridium beijerinckii]
MGLALYISIKIKEELNMPNILMTRIDNRLVHGQVGVTWTTSLGANLLVVVDDTAASDPVQQQLMSMTAESSGVGIRFFTIQKTIDVIHKASPSQKIFIVCKTPEVVRKLVDGGVPIKELNVGNMHFSDGKRAITKKVYVDDKDIEDLKYIESKGVKVFVQDTPGDIKTNIE